MHLGDPANAERAELTMGYRLPGEFLALANRLLPMAAPGVAPSRSVRADGDPADVHESRARRSRAHRRRARARPREGIRNCRRACRRGARRRTRRAIEARGVVLAEPGEVSPDHPVVVLPAVAQQRPRVRRRHRGGTGRDHGERTARLPPAVRGAHAGGATPRARARHRTAPSPGWLDQVVGWATVRADRARSASRRELVISVVLGETGAELSVEGGVIVNDELGVVEIRRDPWRQGDRRRVSGGHRRHRRHDQREDPDRSVVSARCGLRRERQGARRERARVDAAFEVRVRSRSTKSGECRVVVTSAKVHIGKAESAPASRACRVC